MQKIKKGFATINLLRRIGVCMSGLIIVVGVSRNDSILLTLCLYSNIM